MTFLRLYISRWWRQTWDTAPYFTVVNQSEARISTEHGIKVNPTASPFPTLISSWSQYYPVVVWLFQWIECYLLSLSLSLVSFINSHLMVERILEKCVEMLLIGLYGRWIYTCGYDFICMCIYKCTTWCFIQYLNVISKPLFKPIITQLPDMQA